ncbi:MAG: response regulator [Ignavibacteriales bacterium]|jgi:FixJ family two-component response regulator|nr:response regulator [Ignavibacteriales bacterium]
MSNEKIRVLYVNGTEQDVQSMSERLSKFEGARFDIIWQPSAEKAILFLEEQNAVDVIVTEDVLQGMSGVEFTHKLKDLKYDIPVVFLTTSKDVNFAVEVMRMGVKDYLLKEDVVTHVFPQTLLRVVEKGYLKQEQDKLEMKRKRLEAMQEIVVSISDKISEPLEDMNKIVSELEQNSLPEKAVKYLKLIKDNVERMQLKLEKLRNLKEDKTVKYIRDIKMIDLS